MSIENFHDPEIEPTPYDSIERYASDLCTVTNYVSVRGAAESFLSSQFGLPEPDARALLDFHESLGQFPDADMFDNDAAEALNLARIHLYSFMLSRHEMEMCLSALERGSQPDLDDYRQWLEWVLMALEGGEQASHDVEACLAASGVSTLSCNISDRCPFKFVLNTVEEEAYRYYLESNEVELANKLTGRSSGYIDDEHARLQMVFSCLKVYGWIDDSQLTLRTEALDQIRKSMYVNEASI